MNSKVISFIGAGDKGGVGKSTISLNFSICLKDATQQTVALCDLDVNRQEYSIPMLKLKYHPLQTMDAFFKGNLKANLFQHSTYGIDFMVGGNSNDVYNSMNELQNKQYFNFITKLPYTYTIFDCPAGEKKIVIDHLIHSHDIIMIIDQKPTTIDAAKSVLETIVSNLGVSKNISEYNFYLIMNQVNSFFGFNSISNKFINFAKSSPEIAIESIGFVKYDELVEQAKDDDVPFVDRYLHAQATESLKMVIKNYLKKSTEHENNG